GDVVDLRENRVLAVDHRIRRGSLLGEMDHCVRLEIANCRREKIVVVHVADEQLNDVPGQRLPRANPLRQRPYGRQRLNAEFVIPLAAGKIVDDSDRMSTPRQIQRCRPPAVAVSPKHGDLHGATPPRPNASGHPYRGRQAVPLPIIEYSNGSRRAVDTFLRSRAARFYRATSTMPPQTRIAPAVRLAARRSPKTNFASTVSSAKLAADAGTAKLSGSVRTNARNAKNETAMQKMDSRSFHRVTISLNTRPNPGAPASPSVFISRLCNRSPATAETTTALSQIHLIAAGPQVLR